MNLDKEFDRTADPMVYMDVQVQDSVADPPRLLGRIVCRLFANLVPKTVENFRVLCTGSFDSSLCFAGSCFHRIVRGFIIQGGDIEHNDGTGGRSIYGSSFEDEGHEVPHDRAGLLSMANLGPHSNSSQFFFTLDAAPQLDGFNVCFGEVVKGLDVLRLLECMETLPNGRPVYTCFISSCGEILPGFDDGVEDDMMDPFPGFPQDCSEAVHVHDKLRISDIIRKIGNDSYNAQQYAYALEKYTKALRYLEDEYPSFEEEDMLRKARSICILNRAACCLKLGQSRAAIADCEAVLNIFPRSCKAIFRRAQAYIALRDFDNALRDLRSVSEISPGNPAVEDTMAAVLRIL